MPELNSAPEEFKNDDCEEQELDHVQGESRGSYDVVEVPLVGNSTIEKTLNLAQKRFLKCIYV